MTAQTFIIEIETLEAPEITKARLQSLLCRSYEHDEFQVHYRPDFGDDEGVSVED